MAFYLVFQAIGGYGQADSLDQWSQNPEFQVSGYLETYYAFDFNKPPGSIIDPYLFSHHRHNEFNLNVGLIQLDVSHPKYRARMGLHTGTFATDNYAAEPDLLKNIYEAYVGLSLNNAKTLWLDGGIFTSHIGFESAISLDNWTLTRSLLAEHSPYYLSGVKLTYKPNEKWEFAGIISNGWQRIQRLEGNSLLSLGSQLLYRPDENITLNWSTFVGTDDPDENRRLRYFNNLFARFRVSELFQLVIGFDIGAQQKSPGSSGYHYWTSPIIIGNFILDDHWEAAFRAEYFADENQVIISTSSPAGFSTGGLSWNVDYKPVSDLAWRIEGRWLHSKNDLFRTQNGLSNNRFFITTSLAVKMHK